MWYRSFSNGLLIFVLILLIVLTNCIEEQSFYKPTICARATADSSTFYDKVYAVDKIACAITCRQDSKCVSLQYLNNKCGLGSSRLNTDCSNAVAKAIGSYYEKRQPCQNGGYIHNDACFCINGYVGTTCQRLMTDCSEGYTYVYYRDVFKEKVALKIHPPLSPAPFKVKCWFVHGGRTYIQHRDDGSLDFARTWVEYRDGFGDISGDYWLGLEKIYYLTNSKSTRLEYGSFDKENTYTQEYVNVFRIGDTSSNYAVVTVTNEYGDLGQCMTETLGKPFTTPDRDNDDVLSGNCAQKFQSGWWFGACASCNPNGPITTASLLATRDGTEAEAFWQGSSTRPFQIYMWLTDPTGR